MQPPNGSPAAGRPQSGTGSHQTERVVPRPARSKNGCMTCRRRKVRCDEQRPRCSHCERLNLQCMWRPAYAPTQWKFVGAEPGRAAGPATATGGQSPGHPVQSLAVDSRSNASAGDFAWLQSPGGVDQLFDYASFMWNAGADVLSQPSPERNQIDFSSKSDWNSLLPDMNANPVDTGPDTALSASSRQQRDGGSAGEYCMLAADKDGRSGMQIPQPPLVEDHDLISYFVRTVVPPILAEVETQKRWSTMRQMLMSMSNTSAMVRCAILAFSSLLYYRREAPWMPCSQNHYQSALDELLACGDVSSVVSHTSLREHLLATLFFLSYVDILEDRVANAHGHLKRAYAIFQQGNTRGFRPVEIRLLSWIRLLDARAVSAGGEGLFLSDRSEALIVHPSPASAEDTGENEGTGSHSSVLGEVRDWDIEDVLFQVLYHPGIVFFQKVESFMGRISMIDPWHRSRGTVEDETEVMQIASRIMKDLGQLHDDRPALMDHAVEGRLEAPHVSASLAIPITRAFRTYLSNYHASKVHLHRVAYKHLPLSRETTGALKHIRRLTKLLVDDLEPDAALPVSQLWPLLMLGSEEDDPVEREWIKENILRMEKVATNARVTAQVLEEVQARQDASKARVDIRSVMHAIFDSCFAIM